MGILKPSSLILAGRLVVNFPVPVWADWTGKSGRKVNPQIARVHTQQLRPPPMGDRTLATGNSFERRMHLVGIVAAMPKPAFSFLTRTAE